MYVLIILSKTITVIVSLIRCRLGRRGSYGFLFGVELEILHIPLVHPEDGFLLIYHVNHNEELASLGTHPNHYVVKTLFPVTLIQRSVELDRSKSRFE